ncbi:hypothetical protein BUALT_Bualt05G0146700 [Buddleja alternifolia]|uniref:Uncharacterized protein n=1 Tax=Buddleja alternifolia TaxID=168488 RepID=A0AAV6XKS5_9LAMI|nr:hypothetical protein BUALT_Bualt05G0146700 [Buddleja alternifolia]
MIFRAAMLRSAGGKLDGGIRRWVHAAAQPAPLQTSNPINTTLPPLILPENQIDDGDLNFFGGSMELMAVPKRKVSCLFLFMIFLLDVKCFLQTTPHKRGIRNGPKALKPVPVIIRCTGARFSRPAPFNPMVRMYFVASGPPTLP